MKQNIQRMFVGAAFLLFASPVFAHVVVTPNQANIGAFQVFTVGVPNEKEIPVTGLRLVLPQGLKHVSPNVKSGWTIQTKSTGEGESATISEIIWTGGSIPSGQRDDFLFSAQVPAEATTLDWKAYQTYKDGTVVSWDQAPVPNQTDEQREQMEAKNMGPESQTNVINDLAPQATTTEAKPAESTTLWLSVVALLVSLGALALQYMKK